MVPTYSNLIPGSLLKGKQNLMLRHRLMVDGRVGKFDVHNQKTNLHFIGLLHYVVCHVFRAWGN